MFSNVLVPNKTFAQLASDEQIARAKKALEANGFQVLIGEKRRGGQAALLRNDPEWIGNFPWRLGNA